MTASVNLWVRFISTAGHALSPLMSYEIIGAIGIAGVMAHHLAARTLRKVRQGPEDRS